MRNACYRAARLIADTVDQLDDDASSGWDTDPFDTPRAAAVRAIGEHLVKVGPQPDPVGELARVIAAGIVGRTSHDEATARAYLISAEDYLLALGEGCANA
jgi:hypothetical protein